MAKKIRGVKIRNSGDVNKNSGIKITHTINKIKEHEARYTLILTAIFIVAIFAVAYTTFRFDPDEISLEYTNSYAHLSSSGRLVYINENDILSNSDGLNSEPYIVNFSNMTGNTINYVIRFIEEKDMVENCKCDIVDYKSIRFSLDGVNVLKFDNENMIVTSGMIKSNEKGTLNVQFWIDENVPKDKECNYYGKFIFEEFNERVLESSY